MPDFSHVGVRGVWLNVQREFRPGKKFCSCVSKNADFRHVDGEGQRKGELPVSGCEAIGKRSGADQ